MKEIKIFFASSEELLAAARRAMDALSEGKVKEANIILDEAEKDGELALNSSDRM